jgi:hypothetical protein
MVNRELQRAVVSGGRHVGGFAPDARRFWRVG